MHLNERFMCHVFVDFTAYTPMCIIQPRQSPEEILARPSAVLTSSPHFSTSLCLSLILLYVCRNCWIPCLRTAE